MNRRYIVLILGLVIGLALLGRWLVRPDDPSALTDAGTTIVQQSSPDAPSAGQPAAPVSAAASADSANNKAGSGIFRGRMINAVTRQPVRNFDLEFHLAQAMRDPPTPPSYTFKTKDGRFECRDVPPGVWTIYANASGYQRFELPGVAIDKGTVNKEVLMPMRPGHTLQGRVFDASTDQGVAGARLDFREAHVGRYEGDFRTRPSTTSQQDGTFALDGLPEGQVIVSVYQERYGPREVDVTIGNKMAPLQIALSTGGSLSGYLAGADGLTPVAGMVSLINLDESSSSTITTGPAGEFNFPRVLPGRHRLSGRGGGLTGDRELTLSNGERLEGVVLAMRGGHGIRGVVSGLRPEEHASTYVSTYHEGELGGLSVDAEVDAAGAYHLTNVAPGRVTVTAKVRSRGHVSKTVEMPADTDLTVDLEFHRGSRLSGRITRGGKPLSGVSVHPYTEASPDQQDFFAYEVRSSASGEYAIEGLPKGEYSVHVESYRTQRVRVAGDTVFDIDVPLSQLSGRLLEAGGNVPVVGATVDVWSAQPGASRIRVSAQSDHFGQFSVRGLQPGDYVMSVYKPGYELYRAPLAYGSPISDLAVGLRPARGVEIKIRDATSGKAVVNIVTAVELIGGETGVIMRLSLDQNGVAYLPSAIAGSTLKFTALSYLPASIAAWDGEGLEVTLQRRPIP